MDSVQEGGGASTVADTCARVDIVRTLVDNVFGMLDGSGGPERYTATPAER
jgi:hypothetical protein